MKLATGLCSVEDDVVSIICLKIVYFCAESLYGAVLFVLITLERVYRHDAAKMESGFARHCLVEIRSCFSAFFSP